MDRKFQAHIVRTETPKRKEGFAKSVVLVVRGPIQIGRHAESAFFGSLAFCYEDYGDANWKALDEQLVERLAKVVGNGPAFQVSHVETTFRGNHGFSPLDADGCAELAVSLTVTNVADRQKDVLSDATLRSVAETWKRIFCDEVEEWGREARHQRLQAAERIAVEKLVASANTASRKIGKGKFKAEYEGLLAQYEADRRRIDECARRWESENHIVVEREIWDDVEPDGGFAFSDRVICVARETWSNALMHRVTEPADGGED